MLTSPKATWKHTLYMEVTFFQDKATKKVDLKPMTVALKLGRGKKQTTAGTAFLELSDFAADGTRVDKVCLGEVSFYPRRGNGLSHSTQIIPITPGSNPTTLKVSFETQWMFIDGKLIVRNPNKAPSARAAQPNASSGGDDDASYDLQTVTFDSEDEETSIGGADRVEFSADDESAAPSAASADQAALIAQLRSQIAALKTAHEQASGDCKRAEEKLETYRVTIKTKNDQISELKASRDEKIAMLAAYDGKLAVAEERAIALQSKLDATFSSLAERDKKAEADRAAFEKELRELRARNEELHQRLTADTSSNAQFLASMESRNAEAAATLKAERAARRKAEKDLKALTRQAKTLAQELSEVKGAAAEPVIVIHSVSDEKTPREGAAAIRESSEEELRTLRAEVNLLRAECETHKAHVAELTDRALGEAASRESELHRVANERDACKQAALEHELRARQLEREGVVLRDQMQALQQRNAALSETARESLDARAQAQSAMVELREMQSTMMADISTKQRELTARAAEQTAHLDDLRTQAAMQLQSMEMAHVQEKEELRAQLQRLEVQLAQKAEAERELKAGTVVDAALSLGKDVGMADAGALKQLWTRQKLEYEQMTERAREDARRAEEEAARHERRANNFERSLNDNRRVTEEAKRHAAEVQAKYDALVALAEERQASSQQVQREHTVVARRVAELERALSEARNEVQHTQMRLTAATSAAEATQGACDSAEQRALAAQRTADALRDSHKSEVSALRAQLTAARTEARNAEDALAAAMSERDSFQRRVGLLETELEERDVAEQELSELLHQSQAKQRAAQRSAETAQETLVRERAVAAELRAQAELQGRVKTEEEVAQVRDAEAARARVAAEALEASVQRERARADELQAQLAALQSADAEVRRELHTCKEEARAATAHGAQLDELLRKKNGQLTALEAQAQSAEASLAQCNAQVGDLKVQAQALGQEAQSQRSRADAAALLATQLQASLDTLRIEAGASRDTHTTQARAAEESARAAQRIATEAQHATRAVEAERDALRAQCTELQSALADERALVASAQLTAERVPLMQQELTASHEALRAAEGRLQQLREASGDLGRKVESLAALERDRRQRKLIISAVLLGAADEGAAEAVSRSSASIVTSLQSWKALAADGDASCLSKLANSYARLLQSSSLSYYHCVRVLAQLCSVAHALRTQCQLAINDPYVTGVVVSANRSKGQGALDDFLGKMELATERAFVAVGTAVFRRVHAYLAPAILNHMPPQDANKIEETVVDSGNERGKYMSHTVMSTLTDVRDWLQRYALPDTVLKQLFVTLAYNLNAYLFQYLIQVGHGL